MACPNCTSKDLVKIDLAPGGRRMHFSTCRACEHRWWLDTAEDGLMTLDRVLDLVAAA